MSDPLQEVVDIVKTAVLSSFNPDSEFPPAGGGSTTCRVVAGDVVALEMWDAHAQGTDCAEPFLWERVMRRFRSKTLFSPTIALACDTARVVEIEIGVARCSALRAEPDWDELAVEAEISLDDCFRVEVALCRAQTALKDAGFTSGTNTIVPYGPEGGVVAWRGTLFVSL